MTDETTIEAGAERLPIARNTALLSAAQAAHSAVGQLAAAAAAITLVRVLDVQGLPRTAERYDGPDSVEDFVRFAHEDLGTLVRVKPTKIVALDRVGEH